jgi:hypothetical protein
VVRDARDRRGSWNREAQARWTVMIVEEKHARTTNQEDNVQGTRDADRYEVLGCRDLVREYSIPCRCRDRLIRLCCWRMHREWALIQSRATCIDLPTSRCRFHHHQAEQWNKHGTSSSALCITLPEFEFKFERFSRLHDFFGSFLSRNRSFTLLFQ